MSGAGTGGGGISGGGTGAGCGTSRVLRASSKYLVNVFSEQISWTKASGFHWKPGCFDSPIWALVSARSYMLMIIIFLIMPTLTVFGVGGESWLEGWVVSMIFDAATRSDEFVGSYGLGSHCEPGSVSIIHYISGFSFSDGLNRIACMLLQGKMIHLVKWVLRVVALVCARPYMLMMIILLTMPTLTSASLTEVDVRTLLSWSRCARLEVPHAAAQVDDAGILSDEFAFVPELVLAILLSLLPNVVNLRRILRQDWIEEWRGWSTTRTMLQDCEEDRHSESVALECVQDFARISLQSVEVRCKIDAQRKRELEARGKILGVGLVHGNNECCADSMLQLLARQKLSFFSRC